jgi:chitinase
MATHASADQENGKISYIGTSGAILAALGKTEPNQKQEDDIDFWHNWPNTATPTSRHSKNAVQV